MNDISLKTPVKRALSVDLTALSDAQLVDEIGLIKACIADAEKKETALCNELLSRNPPHYVDGVLYTVCVTAETVVWRLDTDKLKHEMGERWVQRYMKHSMRKASIRTSARKEHS